MRWEVARITNRITADVVVVGGGPAGIGAALASAKTGAHTILIERDYRIGGTTVQAEVTDIGECILPAKLFGDIIRRLPEGPVTVVVDDNYKVSIRAGYASFTISAESAEDYPELPDVGSGKKVLIPQTALKELITGTIFAVSENQSRPIHTGVKFEIASDSITAIAVAITCALLFYLLGHH